MRRVLVPVLVVLAICAVSLRAAQEIPDAVPKAITAWLSLIDHGKYAESWQQASATFRQQVTQANWEKALGQARAPLGALVKRTVARMTSATSLPGAPDGQYVVAQFRTEFEHKKSALETVTFMRESDGTWRAVGYFVR
ncbi:MAG TPA: DUF4019 domain-containing protein [Vicinamibacterales bacterium]|jgi:hypothetical protein